MRSDQANPRVRGAHFQRSCSIAQQGFLRRTQRRHPRHLTVEARADELQSGARPGEGALDAPCEQVFYPLAPGVSGQKTTPVIEEVVEQGAHRIVELDAPRLAPRDRVTTCFRCRARRWRITRRLIR